MAQEVFALVDAADSVVSGGCDAVRGTIDVIGDDHPQQPRVALVQRSKLPQVLHALAELPLPCMQRTPVEVGEAHASIARNLLELDEVVLQRPALGILETSKALPSLLHNSREVVKRQALLAGNDLLLHVTQETPRFGPAGVPPADVTNIPQQLCLRRRTDICSQNIQGHVSVNDLEGLILYQCSHGGAVVGQFVGDVETAHRLTMN
mmetsp:Transcript_70881/g.160998  ORF Transcript_70881/g.160998 Transcript_70881/m.160998 type:complete len:207 (-) Transcript_70881:227-847(-)